VIEDTLGGIEAGKKMIVSLGNQKYTVSKLNEKQFLLF